ncbi:hypothetical protein Hanom_Chr00s000001g01593421 [Helianthus anomalus]
MYFFFSSENKSKRGRKKLVLTQPIRKSKAQCSPNSSPNSLRPVRGPDFKWKKIPFSISFCGKLLLRL